MLVICFYSAINYPFYLSILTFFIAFRITQGIEYDKSVHDYKFFTDREPSYLLRQSYMIGSSFEVIVKSGIYAILIIFLFGGTNATQSIVSSYFFGGSTISRATQTANIMIPFIILSYVFIVIFSRYMKVNVSRFAYVRLSVLIGILFSIQYSKVESWYSPLETVWEVTVSYTHLRAHRDLSTSRMPSSA